MRKSTLKIYLICRMEKVSNVYYDYITCRTTMFDGCLFKTMIDEMNADLIHCCRIIQFVIGYKIICMYY